MILRNFIRLLSSKRPESYELRNYLIKKYNSDVSGHHCSMCLKKYPLCLLDTAHLKPRYTMSSEQLRDLNNIEFMCKICHNLYDNGNISIDTKYKIVADSEIIHYTQLDIISHIGKIYSKVNMYNSEYLLWHYKNIFRNKC